MKQYMQNKPIKRGFKIWMLCDQSSYNLKFEIYTGKCSSNVVETGLGAKIVLNLMNEFAGTVNSNRKNLPKLSDDKKMMRGDFDWNTSDTNITMCKWKDKRSVHLLSSRSLPQEPISVKRKQKDGTIVNVPCPQVLVDYNKNMNYVDNFDRLKGDYSLDRKSVKWYMRLVFHFVDCAITNAFIIHKELPNVEHFKNKNFKRNIYNTLLSDKLVAVSQKSKKTLSQGGPASRKPHINKSIRLESSSHQPQRTTSRRCGNCSTKKNPVRSIWECSVCKNGTCSAASYDI
ncbi:piggyBac transposable element-derived protein 4-like [Rhopalosiphum maidis]|uniref:piggyBac transposable element-derived protein 4-like n=1 Tax=Rhopalosiphum maidis TaxID=43146 RepID=UPI00101E1FFD|nr:piggyBac transposable element-derived protein 4-like [Rhopalosiphum maidis]